MPAELNPTIIIAVAAAIGVLLIVFGAMSRQPKDAVQQRLEQLVVKPRRSKKLSSSSRSSSAPFAPCPAPLADHRRRTGRHDRSAEGRLHRAGYPGGLRGADWMGVKVLSAICFGIGFTVLFLAISGFPLNVLFGIGGLAVGFLAPEFWLGRKIRQRSMDMTLQLPDALDLLTISVEAGLGFDAALAKVVEKMEGPLITEFRQALAEIRMGRARRTPPDVATRADAQPVTNFIGAIVQAEQLGVPIAKVLQIQSQQLRIERRQRAEEQAAKAPVKMLFPMVGCIFPTIFIVILGPAIVTVVRGVGIDVLPALRPAILLVDDDPTLRSVLTRRLERDGFAIRLPRRAPRRSPPWIGVARHPRRRPDDARHGRLRALPAGEADRRPADHRPQRGGRQRGEGAGPGALCRGLRHQAVRPR